MSKADRPRPSGVEVTVRECGERLMRYLEAKGLKPTTLGTYASILKTHIYPHTLSALLRAVDPEMGRFGGADHAIFLTAAMTGLRQGELLALRWRDVDWQASKIRVRRNYVRGHWLTPKSRRGSRAVPLADQVAGELDRHHRRTAFTGDDDLDLPLF
jgi:integrase